MKKYIITFSRREISEIEVEATTLKEAINIAEKCLDDDCELLYHVINEEYPDERC